jgi:hypothetical protein
MSHHLPIHSLACLRLLSFVLTVSLCAALWSPPFAVAQEVITEEAPGEDTDAEQPTAEDPVVDEEIPSEEAAEEAPSEDAATEEAPSEDTATEEAPSGEEPAAETPAEEPAAPGPWDVAKPCENYQHPYEADLCQQWRTAEAAEQTATAAERSLGLTRLLMLIGALATLLLLLMFIPLVMAALAARRAARGGAPVSAKGDASREEELRAYVDIDKLEFIETPESEGIVKVKVTFRNSGQTPAFKVRSVAHVGVRDVSDEDLLPVMPLPDRSSLDAARPRLGRDATATEIVQCDSTPSLADRVMNGDATILVWGFVDYMDVFDRRRKTAFQYLCNADTLDTGLIFKPMVRGDEDG